MIDFSGALAAGFILMLISRAVSKKEKLSG